MFVLRHQSLSGERRSCGALWGRDWTFTSTGSLSRCRKKARQEPRPPDLRGVLQLSQQTPEIRCYYCIAGCPNADRCGVTHFAEACWFR